MAMYLATKRMNFVTEALQVPVKIYFDVAEGSIRAIIGLDEVLCLDKRACFSNILMKAPMVVTSYEKINFPSL